MVLITLFIIIVDQLTKISILSTLIPGSSIPLIDKVCYLTLVANRGAAFGILSNYGQFFPVFSFIVIVILTALVIKKPFSLQSLALSLILGGAIGNLIDRLRLGYVVDFIDLRVWPVFNLADSAITVGVILLIGNALVIKKLK